MEEIGIILLLYVIGAVVLVAEIFIPSHGILTVVGLGLLIAGSYKTFQLSMFAGYASLLGVLAFLVTFAVLAIKYWHRTPIGRRISPPNPTLTDEDTGNIDETLEPLLGTDGRALTPLRPVGTCEFDGQRLPCVAEYGMIERGTRVKAIRIHGRGFAVAPATEDNA
jgi:membrane-bound serine protease (ClpP class)